MKLVEPIVSGTDDANTSFVDLSSLSKEDKALVKKVDEGNAAEAALIGKMYDAVQESEFASTELDINSEKGSYLRVATIDGVEQDDGEVKGSAVVAEFVNGHLTETLKDINETLAALKDEANSDVSEKELEA